ncbi:hypothetical protein CL632_01630 [bacterium]|nr:hypothetical protein [bacterium]MDP6571395.1 hypothetical protein [Patescibacteria group bacterium]
MAVFQYISTFLTEVGNQLLISPNPFYSALILIANGLWIPIIIIMLINAKIVWIDWRQGVYHVKNRKFILLAIDVPRDNEQSPKAVESIFAALHGALPGSNNLYQQWWLGKTPDAFSVELISIEGYVQFLVQTQEEYRNMVESAFYAQYPDAEITQVEDYVYGQEGEFKDLTFPSDKYDIIGSEIVFLNQDAYPIRLHMEFEHSLSQEFKDPMASLLETMNSMGPGEQLWFQWVITPEYDDNWHPQSEKLAMKIAGKSVETPQNAADKFIGGLVKWVDAIGVAIFPFYNQTEESEKQDDMPSLMLHLTPAEQKQVESIQLKADKHGFWTKFRYMYIAKKEVASKARGLSPVFGSLKQFSSLNSNSIKPHKYTKTFSLYYLMVPQRMASRQNKLLRAYQNRSRSMGSSGIILNTEELATLYHFPTEVVKAPLVSRTQSKRASAPISLPIEGAPRTLREAVSQPPAGSESPAPPSEPETQPLPTSQPSSASAGSAPSNLPFV